MSTAGWRHELAKKYPAGAAMSIQDMSHITPLVSVSLDTFALIAAILFRECGSIKGTVNTAAALITACQQFDWAAHQKEMNLPKGEQ